jgi:hypothetical protein
MSLGVEAPVFIVYLIPAISDPAIVKTGATWSLYHMVSPLLYASSVYVVDSGTANFYTSGFE